MKLTQILVSPDLNTALSTTSQSNPSENIQHGVLGTLSNLNPILQGGNFMGFTWDMLIILFLLVASFVYGFILGRERIMLILVSIYICIAITETTPFLYNMIPQDYSANNIFIFKIGVFLGLFVLLFFLLSGSRVLRTFSRSNSPGGWWQVIVFSILQVGLLMSVMISFVPEEFYNQLSSFTREWLSGESVQFFWLIAPIVAMALLRDRTT